MRLGSSLDVAAQIERLAFPNAKELTRAEGRSDAFSQNAARAIQQHGEDPKIRSILKYSLARIEHDMRNPGWPRILPGLAVEAIVLAASCRLRPSLSGDCGVVPLDGVEPDAALETCPAFGSESLDGPEVLLRSLHMVYGGKGKSDARLKLLLKDETVRVLYGKSDAPTGTNEH